MTDETTLFLVFGSALLFVCALFYKIGRLAVLMTFLSIGLPLAYGAYKAYTPANLSIKEKVFILEGAGPERKNEAAQWIKTHPIVSWDKVQLEEQKLEQESQSDYEKSLVSHYVNKKRRS